eukprot:CAMPEP_0118887618 /NCGR_PEP_ID=MMETSP1163-20130328/25260_1 /TAXON_ID=124430 /ORGANISM="Phaeomonas parva, Strain CCMP2877" /LENGTH=45 /DNA_ID= /DNA_START= /DNA_END= /DNA_ORIENTATION=
MQAPQSKVDLYQQINKLKNQLADQDKLKKLNEHYKNEARTHVDAQ